MELRFILVPCCPEIPPLVDDIFFKIDERIIIFLWKGVKCFSGGVRKPFRTVPAGSGRLRPIFNFFWNTKKALFQWYTFGQNRNSKNDLKFTKTTIVKRNLQFTVILNSIFRFSPLHFNDRFHDFWHAIDELLSVFNRPCVPNMLERILSHVHYKCRNHQTSVFNCLRTWLFCRCKFFRLYLA